MVEPKGVVEWHFWPWISASGLVRLARADVDVGATVTTDPMKLVAVTTTAYPLRDGMAIRKIEPLRSKITGPFPDPFSLFALSRIACDLGRLPTHLVLHGGEPGQVDRLPDHPRRGLAEFGRDLVEFLARGESACEY